MEKIDLKKQLTEVHNAYAVYVLGLSEEHFYFALPEKWNAGQHLQHILISIIRLSKALDNPKYIIPIEQVEFNRDRMGYDTLVTHYLSFIKKGAKATAPFVPEHISIEQRPQLVKNVQNTISDLCLKLDNYSEDQLDNLTIPHPLLGIITLREMMYFTIQHAIHHYELTKMYIS